MCSRDYSRIGSGLDQGWMDSSMPKSPTDWLKGIARSRGARLEDVEDIAQEATLRMCRHVRQGGVINNKKAFLKSVTANLATDFHRASVVRGKELPLEDEIIVDPAPTPDEQYGLEQLIESICQRLADRSPKICRAFVLSRLHGHEYYEIAHAMSVSVSAVEKYIAIALKELSVARHQFE